MKKIEVRPEKVRGMGNLIPPLSVSDFELSDCMIHEEDPFKINGHLFNHFSIDVPVVPVNLVLSTNVATIYPDATTPNTAVITATLTDSSGAPVSNVDVYFQEEGVRIGTASTNAQGACTFEYSNSSGGTHTIRAYTMKQGKYNKSSAEINVNVYMPTSLSLSPVSTSANTVDIVTLSSKIIDQNDLPLAGKLIDLYRGDVKIKSAYSNSKGIVDFPIRVTDLGKTNTVLTCTTDKTRVTVGENVLCTLYLKDNQNNPLANKTVYCGDWSKTTNDEGRVIFNYANPSTGEATRVFKFDGDNLYNGASVTAKWTVVPAESPQISISASTLIGEVGDDLPITLSSNLKNTALTVLLNDAEVADSVTTDDTGNAVFNYNCNGAGDVNVKVKYLSGTNVYYSNILQVEDCIKYGFKDSDTWINPTGHSATNTVVDGVFTSTSNSSKGDSILQLDLTGDFIITYDAQWQASTRCGIGAKDTTRTQHFDSGTDTNGTNQKYVSYNGSNETDTIYKNSNIAEYVNCKIIKHNNTLTGYMNNTEVVSVNYSWISMCSVWNLHTTIWGSGRTINIKNLKIKPYSE